ncbi:Lysine-specific demethylase 4 [Frankliniella fusca]|uniref:Lysine-specific demethylase 4 n=1 Tax=Frankliniella fusca TaxID=407009 RepID=A0AAE1H4Q0_9NEOP|nr:Lysine-specific demethylase 4 [Frankliniella fusca]
MSGLSLGNTSCWNILGHKTVFPSTQWLEERLIPFEVVVQNPGEAIVLYPNTAHYGFNTGWNLAEAVNFGTVSWIPDGINAPKCQCLEGQIHLDMTRFVSAFMPDLLDKFLSKKFIETQRSVSSISFFNESLKKLIEGGNHTTGLESKCVSSANTGRRRIYFILCQIDIECIMSL